MTTYRFVENLPQGGGLKVGLLLKMQIEEFLRSSIKTSQWFTGEIGTERHGSLLDKWKKLFYKYRTWLVIVSLVRVCNCWLKSEIIS